MLSKPIFVGNISPRKESPRYCEKGVSTKGHSNSPVSKFHDLDKQSTGSPSSGRRNAIHSCPISILNPIWSYSDCIKLYPIAPNSRLHPPKIFANSFSTLLHATTCNRYAFRIHKLPFNRGLPLQKQRQVFAKIIVIAATIFIDILPFSTL